MAKTQQMKNNTSNLRSAIILVLIIFGIIITQILLSVSTASGAYEIANLKQENKDLSLELQNLKQQTTYLDSPQFLSDKAEKIGMVMSDSPAFLRLSDGAVIGTPTPASPENSITLKSGNLVPNALSERYADIEKEIETATKTQTVAPTPTATQEPTQSGPIRFSEGQLIPAPQTR